MYGLEEAGIPGKEYLRDSLTNCADPLKAIEDFQTDNGILLPSLRPMLPLLDLHGVKRQEFHFSVLEELREKLIVRIEDMNKLETKERDNKLKDLLTKSFPLIRVPALQPVVMAILKNLDVVEDKYLNDLVADKSLYEKCDISVKRQIWQQHPTLFGDEVSPILSQYIKEKEMLFFNFKDATKSFYSLSPRVRRQNPIIQTLVKMVGKNVLLYDTILQFLRTLFLRTKNVHYCTLRVSLLMALHDCEVQDITGMDPCHKFGWCLDACIREQNVDPKRSRELQGFLEGVRRGQEHVLGDISMTLCDPYAINFLALSCMKIINHHIQSETLARDNNILMLLLRMLNLGLHSWDVLNSQVFREPRLDPDLITKFVPILMSFIVDDQVRSVNSKLPPDDRESALAIIEHSGPPPDSYQQFITEDRLASILAIYYTLQVTKQKDKQAVMRVLGTLSASHDNRALSDQYLHILVNNLITMSEDFASEEFCSVVFDEIYLPSLTYGNVVHHMMKLLYHIHQHLPQQRLDNTIKILESFSYMNENSKTLFQELQTKVKEFVAKVESQPQQSQQTNDDFASSVLTPAAHRD
ncbi:negative elongation factor B-like [Oppia nitens]|uniref:negative elongation factor B-like n=1 Tax=Oppia nitens TaxID=1686743 RepID=UPI0023DAA9D5|nr:negative elongation factor B-like [Oppia nitens]